MAKKAKSPKKMSTGKHAFGPAVALSAKGLAGKK